MKQEKTLQNSMILRCFSMGKECSAEKKGSFQTFDLIERPELDDLEWLSFS
ncbi:hypothetical protein [Peribacillus muralis]|uniref:hypothetical protein n=1 Tax=Peribacillus muralis TaxID=264697 RepID=UPI003D018CC2